MAEFRITSEHGNAFQSKEAINLLTLLAGEPDELNDDLPALLKTLSNIHTTLWHSRANGVEFDDESLNTLIQIRNSTNRLIEKIDVIRGNK
jgi:hypothetical protein